MPRTGTRPTTDRVRESLFNVLTARIELTGASVLDLYAGSGALGLEALSRGAASALFVESDQRAAAVIAQNIEALGADGATAAARRRSRRCWPRAATGRWTWCWPTRRMTSTPRRSAHAGRTGDRRVGGAGPVVVVERQHRARRLTWPEGWSAWPRRRYGDTRLEMAQLGG